jgi:hypothetical protein
MPHGPDPTDPSAAAGDTEVAAGTAGDEPELVGIEPGALAGVLAAPAWLRDLSVAASMPGLLEP